MTGDRNLYKIAASGTPIGMLPFSSYLSEKYVLGSSARLLVYTDGMTEVFRGEEEFGEARLLQAFSELRRTHPGGHLDFVVEHAGDLLRWAGAMRRHDGARIVENLIVEIDLDGQ